jgi:hypothetical protein
MIDTRTVTQTMIDYDGQPVLIDASGYPVATDAGVRCGNHHRHDKIHHNTTAAVRYCYRIDDALAAAYTDTLMINDPAYAADALAHQGW